MNKCILLKLATTFLISTLLNSSFISCQARKFESLPISSKNRSNFESKEPRQLYEVEILRNYSKTREFQTWKKRTLFLFANRLAKIYTERKNSDNLTELEKFNENMRRVMDSESLLNSNPNTAVQGSGVWGKEQPSKSEIAYKKLWQTFSIAAKVGGFPKSARNMNLYLNNTGNALEISEEEVNTTAFEIGLTQQLRAYPEVWNALKEVNTDLKKISQQSAFHLYVTRNKFQVLAEIQKSITKNESTKEAQETLQNISDAFNEQSGTVAIQPLRQVASSIFRISSIYNSDMFFSMGAFAAKINSVPISIRTFKNSFEIYFSSYLSFYDNYNWDAGKSVFLLADFCFKFFNTSSAECKNISEALTIKVTDASLGRLHTVGIAKEYEIFGIGSILKSKESFEIEMFKQINFKAELEKVENAIEILNLKDFQSLQEGMVEFTFL